MSEPTSCGTLQSAGSLTLDNINIKLTIISGTVDIKEWIMIQEEDFEPKEEGYIQIKL